MFAASHLGGGGQRCAKVRAYVPGLQGGGPGAAASFLLHGQDQLGGAAGTAPANQAAPGLSHTNRCVLNVCGSWFFGSFFRMNWAVYVVGVVDRILRLNIRKIIDYN